jgi:hypothetical protein
MFSQRVQKKCARAFCFCTNRLLHALHWYTALLVLFLGGFFDAIVFSSFLIVLRVLLLEFECSNSIGVVGSDRIVFVSGG